MNITVSEETILLLIKFKIEENLRFLSHAETINVFQRACVRAGIKAQYSQGFNPRPRLSLPIPRSVGTESEGDLLCIRLEANEGGFDCEDLKARLSRELPRGCELLDITVSERKISLQPRCATYVFTIRQECINKGLKDKIEHLLASERLNLERWAGNTSAEPRNIDVRPFINVISVEEADIGQADIKITVDCTITPNGTIRVDEILRLLEIEQEQLAEPVRRTKVEWK